MILRSAQRMKKGDVTDMLFRSPFPLMGKPVLKGKEIKALPPVGFFMSRATAHPKIFEGVIHDHARPQRIKMVAYSHAG